MAKKTYVRHPLWVRWVRMRERCFNPKCPAYPDYGGRGITVCERWLTFKFFVEDLFETFDPSLTLDRIDNNKGYYKENCRWADRTTQNNNTRVNHFFDFNGLRMTLPQMVKASGYKKKYVSPKNIRI